MLNNMPTTEQVLTQVQSQACCKSMSAKNSTYSHTAYCIKRVQEVDKPKAIPVPKRIITQLNNMLPAKGVEQHVESDDDDDNNMTEVLKAYNKMPDGVKITDMTELNNQMSNNKQPQLPMYKHNQIQRPENIEPPTYEVIIKNARLKNQEKYDKLTPKGF